MEVSLDCQPVGTLLIDRFLMMCVRLAALTVAIRMWSVGVG